MKKRRAAPLCFGLLFAALLAVLIVKTVGYPGDSVEERAAVQLVQAEADIGGKMHHIVLPHSFENLTARQPVTLYMDVLPDEGEFLYVKSVYAPLRIYVGDELLYEYGQPGSYPSYLQDPATAVALVRLPQIGGIIHLRLEYLAPSARSTLTVHPLLLGTQTAIYRRLFRELGFSFVFSVMLIFGGLFMLLMALVILGYERRGTAFVWLGLFALAVGCWTFGECNLTGLLIHNPTFLYLLAFSGLFILAVPLLLFGMTIIRFHDRSALEAMAGIDAAAACCALLLQLTGTVALSKSMYLFHILVPLTLCMFSGHILYESIRYRSSTARRSLLPMAVLALFSVLELVNYSAHFTYILSLFFQIGVLIFIGLNGAIGGRFVRESLHLRSEEQRLRYEMELMEYRMEESKKQQVLLLENQETVRAQRHDLRHQLTVLRSFGESGDNGKLLGYIDSLISSIPSGQEHDYCENAAVNAVVSHYAAQAQALGVQLSIRLSIPEQPEHIPDSALCVILGNLLENAVEACGRMTEGERFIRLRSRRDCGTLTVAMDNSFDGSVTKRGDGFLSSKRGEIGTGLRSVTAIAEKYGGTASFEAEGTTFLSSVCVRL